MAKEDEEDLGPQLQGAGKCKHVTGADEAGLKMFYK